MPYLEPFTTLTLEGTLAGGNEIWSAGLHIADHLDFYSAWSAVYESQIDDIATLCEGLVTNAAMLFPSDVHLTKVKLAQKDTTGHYMGAALEVPSSVTGTLNNAYLPQGAIVTTFQSIVWKDPGRYNRWYLPVSVASLGGQWKLDGSQQAAYATAMAEFIEDLNLLLFDPLAPVPARASVLSSSGEGWSNDTIAVRVGAIVDTQRRRRNQLNEAYVSEPVTIS